jgi:hypothetical protein
MHSSTMNTLGRSVKLAIAGLNVDLYEYKNCMPLCSGKFLGGVGG